MREGLHKVVSSEDTIVAVATPPGRSGVGVVRISGAQVQSIAARILPSKVCLNPRQATPCVCTDPSGAVIDDVVAVFFQGPRSYTGEDVLEVSAHGTPLVLGRLMRAVQDCGARLATPGEFTLRAVANGKLDLIQAEAVRDFIEAQTETQARVARAQLSGEVSRRLAPLKEALVGIIANMEAGIDFAEDDVEVPDSRLFARQLAPLGDALEALRSSYSYGRLLTGGLRVAIVGRPNVGKSSLFNRLLSTDRAIVTEIAGTTRDVLSEVASVDGIPVRLLDTAGIRETTDVVESLGVQRTLEALGDADLALFVVDVSSPLGEEDLEVLKKVRDLRHVVVGNKCDVGETAGVRELLPGVVAVSAKTGAGMELLEREMKRAVGISDGESWRDSVLTSARQHEAVARSVVGIRDAASALSAGTPQEMALLDLYSALAGLNELTGETTSEDILGRIFSTFCIGK